MRDGHPCEDCVGTSLLPALRYRCYRGSLPATGAVVWMLSRNRWQRTYQTLVNRYIALTNFAAGRLIAGGLPESRMEVKPTSCRMRRPWASVAETTQSSSGRLSEEKGVRTLLEAWRYVDGFPLKILGDGPLRHELEEQARRVALPVEFLGFRPHEDVLQVVGSADVQIVPSECYENFPMVVLEAYACGTPILASRIGSLDEIVVEGETGMKFEPGNPGDLAKKLNRLRSDRFRLHAMRRKARALFERELYGRPELRQVAGDLRIGRAPTLTNQRSGNDECCATQVSCSASRSIANRWPRHCRCAGRYRAAEPTGNLRVRQSAFASNSANRPDIQIGSE